MEARRLRAGILMSMWSRIGNLFPGKRGSKSPHNPATASPNHANHHALSTSSFLRHGAPDGAHIAFETEAIPSIAESAVVRENTAEESHSVEATAAPVSDPWLAARQRPLVYTHKLRLHAEEAEHVPDGATLDRDRSAAAPEPDVLGPQEISASEEKPDSSNTDEPPAERLPTAAVSASPPVSRESAPSALEESPRNSALAEAEVEQVQPRAGRFAMLRVVAQQWRPTVIKCRYLVVLGSIAEARKLAPVIRTLQAEHMSADEVRVCVAGGRTDRIREALAILSISTDMELTFPVEGVSIDEMRTGMITGFGKLLVELKPEWLVVQGDSVTVAMVSVAAYYAHIPVAHLDSGTTLQDFTAGDDSDPDILHRRIACLFASVHFTDTALGKERLMRDGVPEQYVLVTGNTGVDTMQQTCTALGLHVGSASARASGVVYVLVVAEMPSTIQHGLPDLCQAIRNLAMSVPGLYQFVWPVVGDPKSVQIVNDLLDHVPGVLLSGPAGYEHYLRLLNGCDLVLTDVEDVQEEAPSLGKPVLLMQSATTRPEAQRAGITTLIGSDRASIQAGVRTLARKISVRHGSITNPYGDGRASSRIADFFEGRQVLEFGRTALPKLLRLDEPSPPRLLPQPSQ